MNKSTSTKLTAIFAIFLLLVGCGATQPSPLVTALEAISIAADVGAPVIAGLSPQAAAILNLIPGVVTAALDVVDGTSPLATAQQVITQLQSIWQQGQTLLPNLTGTEKTVITGILAALQNGIQLYQQQYPPTTAALDRMVARGYAAGFFNTSKAATAKVVPVKMNAANKASVARARAHVAAVKAALAVRPTR
jgi:hypothetical protein